MITREHLEFFIKLTFEWTKAKDNYLFGRMTPIFKNLLNNNNIEEMCRILSKFSDSDSFVDIQKDDGGSYRIERTEALKVFLLMQTYASNSAFKRKLRELAMDTSQSGVSRIANEILKTQLKEEKPRFQSVGDTKLDTKDESKETNNLIPKKIHFIWLGGPIPKRYLATIHYLAALAKTSGFEINLWVDNESNYLKTALAEEMEIPNLRIRKIEEVFSKIREDKFYQEDDLGKKYEALIRQEMVGLKNLAAASDLLRYEILREEGGVYFDTDTTFKGKNELKMEESQYGFKIPWDFLSGDRITGGNDIVATIPNHRVLQIAIKDIIKINQVSNISQDSNEAYEAYQFEYKEKKLPEPPKKYKENLINKKRAQQSGCDLLVMSSVPTLENIPTGLRPCYVVYQPLDKAPVALYYVTRDKLKKPIKIDQVTHGFDELMKSSLFHRFRGGQFQDMPQLTYAEVRLIRDITGDKRWIKYDPDYEARSDFGENFENRRNLTIDHSGPGLLIDAFKKYCHESGIDFSNEQNKFAFKQPIRDHHDVLGVTAMSHSDQTWLETKTKSTKVVPQRLFYDDSSVQHSDPSQKNAHKKMF